MASEITFWFSTSGLTNLYVVLEAANKFVQPSDGTLINATAANWHLAPIGISDSACAYRYVANIPAGVAAGSYTYNVYQQAGGSVATSDPIVGAGGTIDWSGSALVAASSILTGVTGTKTQTDKMQFDGSSNIKAVGFTTVAGSAGAGNTGNVASDFEVGTALYWHQSITATGLDSTSWTKMVWTLKASADNDDDSKALLVIRVTEGADSSDGLLVYNGAAASDKTWASLSVDAVTPDTQVTWSIQASAMDLPPSSNSQYQWELDRFIGTRKERIGQGNVILSRSVRRSPSAP